jgi:hypothetical protein
LPKILNKERYYRVQQNKKKEEREPGRNENREKVN